MRIGTMEHDPILAAIGVLVAILTFLFGPGIAFKIGDWWKKRVAKLDVDRLSEDQAALRLACHYIAAMDQYFITGVVRQDLPVGMMKHIADGNMPRFAQPAVSRSWNRLEQQIEIMCAGLRPGAMPETAEPIENYVLRRDSFVETARKHFRLSSVCPAKPRS